MRPSSRCFHTSFTASTWRIPPSPSKCTSVPFFTVDLSATERHRPEDLLHPPRQQYLYFASYPLLSERLPDAEAVSPPYPLSLSPTLRQRLSRQAIQRELSRGAAVHLLPSLRGHASRHPSPGVTSILRLFLRLRSRLSTHVPLPPPCIPSRRCGSVSCHSHQGVHPNRRFAICRTLSVGRQRSARRRLQRNASLPLASDARGRHSPTAIHRRKHVHRFVSIVPPRRRSVADTRRLSADPRDGDSSPSVVFHRKTSQRGFTAFYRKPLFSTPFSPLWSHSSRNGPQSSARRFSHSSSLS